MKYYFRDLLTLLISLFILSGCENPSKVGLDVAPGDQILGESIEIPVEAVTVKEEDILTKNSRQLPLGYFNDPVIGETNATIQFALQNMTIGDSRIPVNAVIDSAIMAISYGRDFFGDSITSTTKIEIRQLNTPYEIGKNYLSNENWDVNPTVLGSRDVSRFGYKEKIEIHTRINAKDSIIIVGGQLRIPMDAAKIKDLFDGNIPAEQFAQHAYYHNRIKGFQISANKTAQVGIGSLIHLAINSELNGLFVYYKIPNEEGQKINFYPISSTNAATQITHTYSAAVQDQIDNPSGNFETVYAQSPAGLRVKLSLPTIASLKAQNLIINKAELVVYSDEDATGTTFDNQAPRLTLYREDIAGQRTPIPDGDTREQISDARSFGLAFGGNYDLDKKRYQFTLTSYIQDLLQGKISNSVFYIAPTSNLEAAIVPYLPNAYAGYRSILGGGLNTHYKMKLNIYYSKIN